MKKALLILFVFLFSLSLSRTVSAGYFVYTPESESTEGELDSLTGDFEASIPDELRDKLSEGSFRGKQSLISDGEREVLRSLREAIFPWVGKLCILFGIIFLSSAASTAHTSLIKSGSPDAFAYVVRCATVLAVINSRGTLVASLESFSEKLCQMMNAFIPAMGALYVSSGNVTSAAVGTSSFALLTAISGNLLKLLVIPSVRISLVLCVISSLTAQKNVLAVGNFVRNFAGTVSALTMLLFTFALSLNMSVAAAADSVSMKTVQFAVGSFVPIVGGAVSDSLGVLGGSLSFIKASCGAGAIVCVAILLIPTLVSLVLDRFTMFVCKYASLAVGGEVSELFSELGANCTLMIAYAVSEGVMFISALTLFVKSAIAVKG